MTRAQIRVLSVVPGAGSMEAVLADFESRGGGIATALLDPRLRGVARAAASLSNIEVLPFPALLGRAVARCGGPATSVAPRSLVEAAVAEACRHLPPDSPMGAVAKFPGLHRRVANVLSELREWRMDAEAMRVCAEAATSTLAARLHSLAEIESEVDRLLGDLGRTVPAYELERNLDLRPEPDARWESVLVVAGSEYSPLLAATLEWLGACGQPMTVCVDRHAGEARLFEGAGQMADGLGAAPIPFGPEGGLARALFTDAVSSDACPRVVIESCADPLAESEWAVRRCLANLEAGIAPESIAMIARDLETYAPLLTASAERLGLPLRLHRRVPLNSNAFARLVLDALAFCAARDVRGLVPILASSYLALGRESRDALEGLVRDALAAGRGQWEVLADAAKASSGQHGWLVRLLAWRAEHVADRAPLAVWNARLRELFADLAAPDDPEAVLPTTERDQWAQSAFQRALAHAASIDRVRENPAVGLAEFAAECRSLCDVADAPLPPLEEGIAVVASAEELGPVRSVHVLGMLEGVFPRRRAEDPVLFDSHRQELGALRSDLPPLPDSRRTARAERDAFYRACTAASEQLVFSYPETEEDRDNVPAFYLAEVSRAAGEAVERSSRARLAWVPEGSELCSEADRRLFEALAKPRERPQARVVRSEEARAKIRAPEAGPFSTRDLRDALECPFRGVARSRLHLHGPAGDAWWSGLRRLAVKGRLASSPDEESARRALLAALDAEIETVRPEASAFDVSMMRIGGPRLVEEMVQREFRARSLWQREEGSTALDARFGDGPLRQGFPIDGGFALAGGVDAVSRIGPYRVAHLFRGQMPPTPDDEGGANDLDLLEIQIVLLALWGAGPVAVEVDTPSDGRALFVLPRVAEASMISDQAAGLRIVSMGEPRPVLDATREALREAVDTLRSGVMQPVPGEACLGCGYGELCRRSQEFSDEPALFEGGA